MEKIKSKRVRDFFDKYSAWAEKEPDRVKEKYRSSFFNEFGMGSKKDVAQVITPVETIKIDFVHYQKIKQHADRSRKEFLRFIRPTLERPIEIRKEGRKKRYIKLFGRGKRNALHVVIVKVVFDGSFYVTSMPVTRENMIRKEIEKGDLEYSVALRVFDGDASPETT